MQPQPPRKTIVGPTGRSPIKAVATTPRYNTAPLKTMVGSTAALPRKTVVGPTAAPRPKVIVGSTAAPPRKTMPGNLGVGGTNPLGMPAADRGAINAANMSTQSRSLGNRDANPGRSMDGLGKIVGPPNPTMSWEKPQNASRIVAGGMGNGAVPKGLPAGRARAPRGSRKASAFFGE